MYRLLSKVFSAGLTANLVSSSVVFGVPLHSGPQFPLLICAELDFDRLLVSSSSNEVVIEPWLSAGTASSKVIR